MSKILQVPQLIAGDRVVRMTNDTRNYQEIRNPLNREKWGQRQTLEELAIEENEIYPKDVAYERYAKTLLPSTYEMHMLNEGGKRVYEHRGNKWIIRRVQIEDFNGDDVKYYYEVFLKEFPETKFCTFDFNESFVRKCQYFAQCNMRFHMPMGSAILSWLNYHGFNVPKDSWDDGTNTGHQSCWSITSSHSDEELLWKYSDEKNSWICEFKENDDERIKIMIPNTNDKFAFVTIKSKGQKYSSFVSSQMELTQLLNRTGRKLPEINPKIEYYQGLPQTGTSELPKIFGKFPLTPWVKFRDLFPEDYDKRIQEGWDLIQVNNLYDKPFLLMKKDGKFEKIEFEFPKGEE